MSSNELKSDETIVVQKARYNILMLFTSLADGKKGYCVLPSEQYGSAQAAKRVKFFSAAHKVDIFMYSGNGRILAKQENFKKNNENSRVIEFYSKDNTQAENDTDVNEDEVMLLIINEPNIGNDVVQMWEKYFRENPTVTCDPFTNQKKVTNLEMEAHVQNFMKGETKKGGGTTIRSSKIWIIIFSIMIAILIGAAAYTIYTSQKKK